MAENKAPTTKKADRPIFSDVVSAGSRNNKPKTRTAKMARVRNWRFKYADAPSWIATAISFIESVPSLALRTCLTNASATNDGHGHDCIDQGEVVPTQGDLAHGEKFPGHSFSSDEAFQAPKEGKANWSGTVSNPPSTSDEGLPILRSTQPKTAQ
jgi:hypothetical protein